MNIQTYQSLNAQYIFSLPLTHLSSITWALFRLRRDLDHPRRTLPRLQPSPSLVSIVHASTEARAPASSSRQTGPDSSISLPLQGIRLSTTIASFSLSCPSRLLLRDALKWREKNIKVHPLLLNIHHPFHAPSSSSSCYSFPRVVFKWDVAR